MINLITKEYLLDNIEYINEQGINTWKNIIKNNKIITFEVIEANIEYFIDKKLFLTIITTQKVEEEIIDKYFIFAISKLVSIYISCTQYWKILLRYQKLSEEFIGKNINRFIDNDIDKTFLVKYQILSQEFCNEFNINVSKEHQIKDIIRYIGSYNFIFSIDKVNKISIDNYKNSKKKVIEFLNFIFSKEEAEYYMEYVNKLYFNNLN